MWKKCSKNPVENGISTKSIKMFLRRKTGFSRFSKNHFFQNHVDNTLFEVFGKKAPLLSTFVVTPVTTVERSGAMLLTVKKIVSFITCVRTRGK